MTEEEALRHIAALGPDERLALALAIYVKPLKDRGWLQTFGCSDGDYVEITAAGQAALAGKPGEMG